MEAMRKRWAALSPEEQASYSSKSNNSNHVPRALSAYNLFVKSAGTEFKGKGMKGPQVLQVLRDRWQGLSDQEKAAYVQQAAEEKVRAATARQQLKASRPPVHTNAYTSYVSEVLPTIKQQHPGLPITEYFKLVAAQWKALPEGDITRRKEAAKKAMDTWRADHPTNST